MYLLSRSVERTLLAAASVSHFHEDGRGFLRQREGIGALRLSND
jgi:hypothetical protein